MHLDLDVCAANGKMKQKQQCLEVINLLVVLVHIAHQVVFNALIWFEDQCDEFRHRWKAVVELI